MYQISIIDKSLNFTWYHIGMEIGITCHNITVYIVQRCMLTRQQKLGQSTPVINQCLNEILVCLQV